MTKSLIKTSLGKNVIKAKHWMSSDACSSRAVMNRTIKTICESNNLDETFKIKIGNKKSLPRSALASTSPEFINRKVSSQLKILFKLYS